MTGIAAASINTFGQSPKAALVPPSEEPVFILTATQLKDVIERTVLVAVAPLKDHMELLVATVDAQNQKIASLEATQEQEISRVCVDIAYDRQRLAALEKVEPQPMQKDRGNILRALLAANGGKMLAKDARKMMHLGEATFSTLVSTMKDDIETKPYHLNKRSKVLILKL